MEISLISLFLTDWFLILILFIIVLALSQVLIRECLGVIVSFYPALFFSEYTEQLGFSKVLVLIESNTGITVDPFTLAYIPAAIIFITLFRNWMSSSFSVSMFEGVLLSFAFIILYSVTFSDMTLFTIFETFGLTLTVFWQNIIAVLPLVILFFIAIN